MTERDTVVAKYQLDDVDKRLLEYKVRFPKISAKDLGTLVNLERRAVGARLRKPQFKAALEDALLPSKELLERRLGTLTRKYLAFCNSPNEVVAERATRQVLMTFGILKDKPAEGESSDDVVVIEMESRGKTIEIKNVTPVRKETT